MSAAGASAAGSRWDGHPDHLLSALLDGELDIPTTGAVEDHVEGCDACRAELDETALVREALRTAVPVTLPSGYIDRVVARRRRATRQGVTVTALAASVAAVLGLVVAGASDESPEPVESSWSAASAGAAGGHFLDDVRATLADPGGQPGPEVSGANDPTGGRRAGARRPGPDDRDDRIADPPRHGVPSAGDEDSVLDRAREIGGELLDLLGG